MTRETFKRIGIFIAGALLMGAGLFAAVLIGSRDATQAESRDELVDSWTRSIERLGIRPIFPPREDFYVGDLIAADFSQQGGKLFKTVSLAHINMQAALADSYRDLPVFPPTPAGYDGSSPVASEHDIFDPQTSMRSLPIEAFPDSIIASASAQSAGANVFGRLGQLIGYERTASTVSS